MNGSFLYGFIAGCVVSGTCFIFLHLIRNSRTLAFETEQKNKSINLLFEEYADLMHLIKKSINEPEHQHIKEFFVVDKTAIMSSATPRLRFDLCEEIFPLLEQLQRLQHIEKISHDSLLYRMDEDFIRQLKTWESSEPSLRLPN
ncbi:MAG: hypothetical protein PSV35_07715 [bacterium]|nr:hypothetical protein [bacterium]